MAMETETALGGVPVVVAVLERGVQGILPGPVVLVNTNEI